MFVSYFTEQPYSAFIDQTAMDIHPFDHPARRPGDNILIFPNRFFDPEAAAALYKERLLEYEHAEDAGFDGIMINEHHTGLYCMQPRINIMAAVLAARTKRVKIVQLGNPLPIWDNPVQLSEELSLLDMISGGRMVTGIVRGGGVEQISNNANPAFNRERMAEAHDLLIDAWTRPGPFRWEGEHYQFRVVNPWVAPLQKPHPPIWVPGVVSTETVEFAAERGYPYICLNTTVEETNKVWDFYDNIARRCSFEGGPSYRGYLMRVHVADTEARAIENAREFMWMRGQFTGLGHPVWAGPAGYSSKATRTKRVGHNASQFSFEGQLESGQIIAGTPKQVIEKIEMWLEKTRPGLLMLWPTDGRVSHADNLRCIELLGSDVLPAIHKTANSLGLKSPFETGQPVSLRFAKQAA